MPIYLRVIATRIEIAQGGEKFIQGGTKGEYYSFFFKNICIYQRKTVSLRQNYHFIMKRLLLIPVLLCGLIMSVFSSDYYRIIARKTYSCSHPSFWHEQVREYKYDDVVLIDAFQQDKNYVFVHVANSNPEEWIFLDYVVPMTPDEIAEYTRTRKLSVGYPWANFNTQLARSWPYYTILYWITVLLAIYSLIFFILLYNKAKSRKKLPVHIVYGVCSLLLWFWVFHFGTLQFLLIGSLCAALLYPISYTRLAEEHILYNMLSIIALLGCLVISWIFLREWEVTAVQVGFFSWLLCIVLTFINSGIPLLLVAFTIDD